MKYYNGYVPLVEKRKLERKLYLYLKRDKNTGKCRIGTLEVL